VAELAHVDLARVSGAEAVHSGKSLARLARLGGCAATRAVQLAARLRTAVRALGHYVSKLHKALDDRLLT
jgi:hypothetical protein